jgi:hypothetical protein
MAAAPFAPGQQGDPGGPPPLRRTVVLGVVIGAANALGLLGFEWVTEHLTDLIWNDWAGSDEVRWRVLPLAIAGSVALSLTLRVVRQTRMQPPHTDVLAEADQIKPSSLRSIAVLLGVGVVSLVGGASLGPEGAVIPASIALGAWAAGRTKIQGPMTELLVLSSIGALLVSFFGSLIPTPIPLLIMRRQGKPLTRRRAIPPVPPASPRGRSSLSYAGTRRDTRSCRSTAAGICRPSSPRSCWGCSRCSSVSCCA